MFIDSMHLLIPLILGYVFGHCANVCWADRFFCSEEIHFASDKKDLSFNQHLIRKCTPEFYKNHVFFC